MKFAAALVLFLGVPQDSDISRWIEDLGHEEIARRDEAKAKLLKAGAAALPALQRTAESGRFAKNPDILKRLEETLRLVRESVHDGERRPSELGLVTLDSEETTVDNVLKAIMSVKQCFFDGCINHARKVRIAGKEIPFRQVMDSLEDQLNVTFLEGEGSNSRTFIAKEGQSPRPPRKYLPGLTLSARRTSIKKEGRHVGWMLQIDVEGSGYAYLDRFQVRGPDDGGRAMEVCKRCGNKIFLKTDLKEELRLIVEGELVWFSNYAFELSDPEKERQFKVGAFTLAYEFPRLKVTREGGMTDRYNPVYSLGGRSRSKGSLGFNGGTSEIKTGEEEHTEWCGGPAAAFRPASFRVIPTETIDLDPKGELKRSDIESVDIRFEKPVREPFKVTLSIPAE